MTKKKLGTLVLSLWVIIVIFIISTQMITHLVSFNLPKNISEFHQSILANEHKMGQWTISHIIYENCSCTNSLLKRIIQRGPFPNAHEVIFLIGKKLPFENDLINAGFHIRRFDKETFVQQFNFEAAPILSIHNHLGDLSYLGGYFKTSAAKISLDEDIITHLYQGKNYNALPVYGCAVSERVTDLIDPLRINEI